jgi:hypothetical protein
VTLHVLAPFGDDFIPATGIVHVLNDAYENHTFSSNTSAQPTYCTRLHAIISADASSVDTPMLTCTMEEVAHIVWLDDDPGTAQSGGDLDGIPMFSAGAYWSCIYMHQREMSWAFVVNNLNVFMLSR